MKYRARIFIGSTNEDAEDPETWIRQFERIARANGWTTDSDRIVAATISFSGQAKHWCQSEATWIDDVARTWDEFKTAFIRWFRPTGFEDKLQHELYTICQGQNEPVMSYTERFKTAAQALGKMSSNDSDAIARIWIVGLRSEIRRHVLFQRLNTYALAVDYACRAEEAEGQSAGPLLHVVEEPKNLMSQLSLEAITKGLAELNPVS